MGGIAYVIREGRPEDEGFIASAYVSTCRMSMPRGHLNRMPEGAFNAHHYGLVARLLKACTVKVAAPPHESERLFGYSLVEGNQVHMVYVSKSHWRLGIGKALLSHVNVSEMVFRLWPNTQHGSATEWLWGKIQDKTYLPYWIDTEGKHG